MKRKQFNSKYALLHFCFVLAKIKNFLADFRMHFGSDISSNAISLSRGTAISTLRQRFYCINNKKSLRKKHF